MLPLASLLMGPREVYERVGVGTRDRGLICILYLSTTPLAKRFVPAIKRLRGPFLPLSATSSLPIASTKSHSSWSTETRGTASLAVVVSCKASFGSSTEFRITSWPCVFEGLPVTASEPLTCSSVLFSSVEERTASVEAGPERTPASCWSASMVVFLIDDVEFALISCSFALALLSVDEGEAALLSFPAVGGNGGVCSAGVCDRHVSS